jgi:DNA-binding MarR family transcriptional regulator
MAEHPLHPFTPADAEKAVLHIILARRKRANLFAPELFSDPAWDLLLVLFLARLRQQRMTAWQLTRETGVSETTALRWLDALGRHDLVRRRSGPPGNTSVLVELTPRGTAAMQQWLEEWVEAQSGPAGDSRVIDLLSRIHQDND